MNIFKSPAALALVAAPVLGFTSRPTILNRSTDLNMVVTPLLQKAAVKAGVVLGSAALAGTGVVKLVLDKPSRTYGEGTVAEEYDEWTEEGILEYYWGEHIHLGYYSAEEKYRYKCSCGRGKSRRTSIFRVRRLPGGYRGQPTTHRIVQLGIQLQCSAL